MDVGGRRERPASGRPCEVLAGGEEVEKAARRKPSRREPFAGPPVPGRFGRLGPGFCC